MPCAAADLHVDRRYLKHYLRSTRRAATFLAQNLLIVACLPRSSSFELNGLCAIFPSALRPRPLTVIFPLALWPHTAIFPLALRPRPLSAISIYYSPHGDNRFFSSAYTAICASRRFSLSRLAAAPHGDSFYPTSRQCLMAILFFPPRGGASWRFFFSCLAAAPHGDSFSPALR